MTLLSALKVQTGKKKKKKSKWWNTWICVFCSVIPANILQLRGDNINARVNDSNGSYTFLKKGKLLINKESVTKTISFTGVLPFRHKLLSYNYRRFSFPMQILFRMSNGKYKMHIIFPFSLSPSFNPSPWNDNLLFL